MSSNSEINENKFKLACFLLTKCPNFYYGETKEFLESDFDFNFKLKSSDLLFAKEQQFVGYTILHFLAELYSCQVINYLDTLIDKGADFLIQNNEGYSPLLLAFMKGFTVTPLLLAQFKANNPINLRCKNGLSHFHVSCSTNNIKLINFFFQAGASVNEKVNNDSPIYPGYTPLHIAIEHNKHEAVQFLLNHGASLHSQNTNKITPLHLLITNLIENKPVNENLKSLVYSKSLNFSDNVGFTSLHIHSIFNKLITKLDLFEQNIDAHVRFDSPIYPGYTALHFASHFDLHVVTSLLKEKADILAKDANGLTPFDICLKKFNLIDIITIILSEKRYRFSELKFTDGTSLVSTLLAMGKNLELKQYKLEDINTYIPHESLIWPGCTLLHLAVIFNHNFALELMSNNADITMLNADGSSPLHLAFYMKKDKLVKSILNFHKKFPVDAINRDNLSHLHISCAEGNSEVVKLLLRENSNVNLPTLTNIKDTLLCKGSTPFHVAVLCNKIDCSIVETLLSAGANPNLSNENGETPFEIIVNRLSSPFEKNEQLQEFCAIMFKTDPSARITSHFAVSILLNCLQIKRRPVLFKRLISELIELKIYEKLGLTKLEVACAIGDLPMLKSELEAGADLNRCIDHKSLLWSGDTALHILFRQNEKFEKGIGELLYKYKANPTIKNANNLTPVFLSSDKELETAIDLLRDKFTDINPANEEGLTHFHLSCKTKNVLVVKQFLKNGINVNMPISYFANHNPGYTPLHFAIKHSLDNISKLLICYNANPFIKAVDGTSPLQPIQHRIYSYNWILNHLVNNITAEKEMIDMELKDQIGSDFCVEYFFSKQFVVDYKRMHVSRRQTLLNFYFSFDLHMRFPQLYSLIMTQCHLARERTQLYEPATIALQNFTRSYCVGTALPELCCECIFNNLSNADLKNLIRAESEKLELAPFADNY